MPASINNNLMAANVANNLNSHYGKLATSVERLSSGLRINSAADDAAGLAIRELMRADVAALNQGVRNANDAISMLQVVDGALGIIDEKLIRMKELAEQAATGTYNSTQRLMIHSEFVAMAEEIDRIARATDFNGIKLLDGSLTGAHDGSGLNATGKMKIHFGAANDSAEDYYYVEIGDCTTGGLGLRNPVTTNANIVSVVANNGGVPVANAADPYDAPILQEAIKDKFQSIDRGNDPYNFSCVFVGIIPKGTTGFSLILGDNGANDTIQIFKRDGTHIAGTTIDTWTKPQYTPNGVLTSDFMTEANGFLSSSSYDPSILNGTGNNLIIDYSDQNNFPIQSLPPIDGMNIGYTGDGNENFHIWQPIEFHNEEITIDYVTEDLIVIIDGYGSADFKANWTSMPSTVIRPDPDPPDPPNPPGPSPTPQGDLISIKTQDEAQQALERIDDAIVAKDKVRAHLGALQNRLENTVTNLTLQGENLQTAESRISDIDVATEMTTFVRNQVLTQSAVAMLGQANSYPHMLSGLITG